MKYLFLLLIVYGVQVIRVVDDVRHFQDSEKCKPCYHHRFLKTEIKPDNPNYMLIDPVSILV